MTTFSLHIRSKRSVYLLTFGSFVYLVQALLTGTSHQTSFLATEEGVYYEITRNDLLEFFEECPGVQLSLHSTLWIGSREAEASKAEDESILF